MHKGSFRMLFTSWLESIFNIVRMSNWLCLRHIKSALDKVDQLWSLKLFIKNQVITQNYCLSRWTYKIRTKDLFIHNVLYRIEFLYQFTFTYIIAVAYIYQLKMKTSWEKQVCQADLAKSSWFISIYHTSWLGNSS